MPDILQRYADKRPYIHFTPPSGWMNDPNGLIYAYGYYHLFYQHNPFELKHGPMYWGHARSKNLLEWEHLPIALSPDSLGDIFSGSAVLDINNVSGLGKDKIAPILLFFTHHRRNEIEGQVQVQSFAYSDDMGVGFKKYSHNPIITLKGESNFRDPKVFWHNESRAYVMIVAAWRKFVFYRSENLLDWTPAGDFKAEGLTHRGIFECPDLIRLGSKWVLIASFTESETDDWAVGYWTGDFDGTTFIPDTASFITLDYGRDNYAFVTFDGIAAGRCVAMGLMNCWKYADKIPASTFRGSMTIPRELTLTETPAGFRLSQSPVTSWTNETKFNSGTPAALPDTPFMLSAVFEHSDFSVTLSNDTDILTVIYDSEHKKLFCDRSQCGDTDFSPSFDTVLCVPIEHAESFIDIQIIIDVTSIELFALNGTAVITAQFFINAPLTSAAVLGNAKHEITLLY